MRRPRLVCASCNGPVDEGRCPTCRRNRPTVGPDTAVSPSLLLVAIALLLVVWLVLAHL